MQTCFKKSFCFFLFFSLLETIIVETMSGEEQPIGFFLREIISCTHRRGRRREYWYFTGAKNVVSTIAFSPISSPCTHAGCDCFAQRFSIRFDQLSAPCCGAAVWVDVFTLKNYVSYSIKTFYPLYGCESKITTIRNGWRFIKKQEERRREEEKIMF